MPMTSAARRASRASSRVQQPRAPLRNDCGLLDSARCTPVKSWPASCARAAATAESTPPDIAASTLIRGPRGIASAASDVVGWIGRSRPYAVLAGPAGTLDDRADHVGDRVDVGGPGRVTEREAQRPAREVLGDAHRDQHVAGLRHPCGAGGAGGALDAPGVEQEQQGVALAAGEGEVRVARQPMRQGQVAVATEDSVRYGGDHSAYEVVAQGGEVLGADRKSVVEGTRVG